MPKISLTDAYMEVWIAHFYNMTPQEFQLQDWDEQAKMIAFYYAKTKVDQFYQEAHENRMKALQESTK